MNKTTILTFENKQQNYRSELDSKTASFRKNKKAETNLNDVFKIILLLIVLYLIAKTLRII